MEGNHGLRIILWGPLACFTDANLRVERWSYPHITCSAARGVLRNIYSCHGIDYHIKRVGLLRPVQWYSFSKREYDTIGDMHKGKSTPRSNGILIDVKYIVDFDVLGKDLDKYQSIVRKRCREGSYYSAPYLGQREYICYYSLGSVREEKELIKKDDDFGSVFHHCVLSNGVYTPVFMESKMRAGWINMELEEVAIV